MVDGYMRNAPYPDIEVDLQPSISIAKRNTTRKDKTPGFGQGRIKQYGLKFNFFFTFHIFNIMIIIIINNVLLISNISIIITLGQ